MSTRTSTTLETQWQSLSKALEQLRSGQGGIDNLSARASEAAELRAALPERFETVLGDLLDRLSASALFSDESCSFSQKDLLDGLQSWLAHARLRLEMDG
ncbi:hypothetical protein [Variovorax sp. OV329]|uniref:hypothetical protein n=1 Tax=Variovorax sp. OV329 TaxID=1882825 RepID=UPI0008EBA588|nr:hypothetical protein [Variovorax sp. OV329]SFM55905.1 hypothetical protein SAMN05444747_106211 [Variovorax sp. OV329]